MIETRCCQCGTVNENDMPDPRHGHGRRHGTELAVCSECQDLTVQNRCGRSVPKHGA